MDEDDWASDGEDGGGLGDINALPEVKVVDIPPPPKPVSPKPTAPPPNAWTSSAESGDMRASLARAGPKPHHHHPPGSRVPRRPVFPSNSAIPSKHHPHSAPHHSDRQRSMPNARAGVSLFVSNLPMDTTQAAITAFFTREQFPPVDVHILRQSNSGNVRAAVVTLHPDALTPEALSLDGKPFSGRALSIRLDNDRESRRRQHNSFQHHDRPTSDRFSDGPSHSNSFASKDRRDDMSAPPSRQSARGAHLPNRNDHHFSTGRPVSHDRSAPPHIVQNERPSQPAGPGAQSHEWQHRGDRRAQENGRQYRGAGRDSTLAQDPTIPTGPIPSGRKKLQLKPRTKPMPVLEVDQRAIDGPKASSTSGPAAMKRETVIASTMKKEASPTPAPVDAPSPSPSPTTASATIPDVQVSAAPAPSTPAVVTPAVVAPIVVAPAVTAQNSAAPVTTAVAGNDSAVAASIAAAPTAAAPTVAVPAAPKVNVEVAQSTAPTAVLEDSATGDRAVGNRPGSHRPGPGRRPGAERFGAARPGSDRFLSGRNGQDRSLSRRRGQRGGNDFRKNQNGQADGAQKNDRNAKGGKNGSGERGSWKNAKGSNSFKAAPSPPEEEKTEVPIKSANPFAALEDHSEADAGS